jgi:hypothetical protein
MHTTTLWVLSPSFSIQVFTDAIMAWVDPPGIFHTSFSAQDST